MSEIYTSEIIENTRRQMKETGYESVKEGMLRSVTLTQSWFELEDLKEIMPENEYQELLRDVETKSRGKYTRDKFPEVSQEEIEEAIREKMESTNFTISNDANGGYTIEEYFARNKITRPIDVKDIDGEQLAKTIAKVMQKHLDYGTFHANEYYSAEEIEKALKYNIDMLKKQKEVFEQDRGKVEKENKKVLDSAIEATEKTTTTSMINKQAQGIKGKGKDENVEETEIVE